YATTFLGVFQHINVRTPQWLGYFVQRPESHSLHHGRGIHQYNYSDLPLFDILFGTFRNPKEFVIENGFYDGASAKIGQLLLFKDVAGSDFVPAMQLARLCRSDAAASPTHIYENAPGPFERRARVRAHLQRARGVRLRAVHL